MEKIGNMQIVDNKENKFFCFPMISMACTGSGYEQGESYLTFSFFISFKFMGLSWTHPKQVPDSFASFFNACHPPIISRLPFFVFIEKRLGQH